MMHWRSRNNRESLVVAAIVSMVIKFEVNVVCKRRKQVLVRGLEIVVQVRIRGLIDSFFYEIGLVTLFSLVYILLVIEKIVLDEICAQLYALGAVLNGMKPRITPAVYHEPSIRVDRIFM